MAAAIVIPFAQSSNRIRRRGAVTPPVAEEVLTFEQVKHAAMAVATMANSLVSVLEDFEEGIRRTRARTRK